MLQIQPDLRSSRIWPNMPIYPSTVSALRRLAGGHHRYWSRDTDHSKLQCGRSKGKHHPFNQFIDELLTEDKRATLLPHLPKRWHLEKAGSSVLENCRWLDL